MPVSSNNFKNQKGHKENATALKLKNYRPGGILEPPRARVDNPGRGVQMLYLGGGEFTQMTSAIPPVDKQMCNEGNLPGLCDGMSQSNSYSPTCGLMDA